MMTSSEFVRWKVYFDEEPNEFNPLYYYLAQLAKEIRMSWVKDPDKLETKKFLLRFERPKSETQEAQLDEDAKASRTQNSKNFWLGMLRRVRPTKKKK